MMFVALHADIVELKLINRSDRRIQPQLWFRLRSAAQLLSCGLNMIVIEVKITKCVHKLANGETGYSGRPYG